MLTCWESITPNTVDADSLYRDKRTKEARVNLNFLTLRVEKKITNFLFSVRLIVLTLE